MENIVFLLSFSIAFLALFLCYYAHVRISKFQESVKDMDWATLANMTGEVSTVKKTIQTLNNRLNGLHSPKAADEEIMRYMANKQVANNNNTKIIGG